MSPRPAPEHPRALDEVGQTQSGRELLQANRAPFCWVGKFNPSRKSSTRSGSGGLTGAPRWEQHWWGGVRAAPLKPGCIRMGHPDPQHNASFPKPRGENIPRWAITHGRTVSVSTRGTKQRCYGSSWVEATRTTEDVRDYFPMHHDGWWVDGWKEGWMGGWRDGGMDGCLLRKEYTWL